MGSTLGVFTRLSVVHRDAFQRRLDTEEDRYLIPDEGISTLLKCLAREMRENTRKTEAEQLFKVACSWLHSNRNEGAKWEELWMRPCGELALDHRR